MKFLNLSALLCAMMALTQAAVLLESKDGNRTVGDVQERKAQAFIVDFSRSTSCPRGWSRYNNRCFLYVPRAMTWAQAERNCQSMGANLASVHKAEEYHWVQRMISDHVHASPRTWFGGSDGEEEGVWFWSDGTPFSFSYWCRGEPNNQSSQQCLQVNFGDGKCWDDVQCYYNLPSVCAKRI
ncbi:hypothetical protein Q5P01_002864 [Channa striata]|uniref:C-type lectin domain-containing protein n=1 Tax=Channa striata TaxID=64152 RepID=A0AA88NNB1_CHASR|nr:hypothetical protein Q5P01_002864 [Channa striata]